MCNLMADKSSRTYLARFSHFESTGKRQLPLESREPAPTNVVFPQSSNEGADPSFFHFPSASRREASECVQELNLHQQSPKHGKQQMDQQL